MDAGRGAPLLRGPLGDFWRQYLRRTLVLRWVSGRQPDPAQGLGAWDRLGNLIADGAAAAVPPRLAAPHWLIARRSGELAAAAPVHDCVPRRRRRTALPQRRWVHHRVAAPAGAGLHPVGHDQRTAQLRRRRSHTCLTLFVRTWWQL